MKLIKKVLRSASGLINPLTILSTSTTSSSNDKNVNIIPFFTAKHVIPVETEYSGFFENEAIQYWKVYFDFAYYILVVPFRFVWNPLTGNYICYTNKLQQILHYAMFFLTTCVFLLRLRKISSSTGKVDVNPTEYFDVAVYFFDSTFMVLLFLHFGRQKDLVHQVFLELQNHNNGYYRDAIHYRKTRLQCALILIACLLTVVVKFMEMLRDQNYNFEDFFHYRLEESEEIFICKDMTSIVPWLFVFFNICSTLYEKVLNDFGDILFTMTALLFKSLVTTFKFDMENADKSENCSRRNSRVQSDHFSEFSTPSRVLNHYTWLKHITNKINSAMSIITGAFIAGNLPFFATHVLDVFGGENWNVFVRLRYIFACTYFFPSMFIAANANKKVETIKEWVCKEENYSRILPLKLNAFFHELSFHSIGLSIFGVLVITWSSVGSIVSIIITYALLKTQFKLDPNAGRFDNHTITSLTYEE